MAKGIKKFDQEIRVIDSWISISSSTHANTLPTNYGAYYVYDNKPWFAEDNSTHYILANNNDLITLNTLVTSVINSGITFSNGTTSGIVKIGETLTILGGNDITVAYDSGAKEYTIDTSSSSANDFLTGAAFTTTTTAAAVVTYTIPNQTNVPLDIHNKLKLDNLDGVTTASVADGDFLIYNGSSWAASSITDVLKAGDGITFDTTISGEVTIDSSLYDTISAGTWLASDGTHTEYIGLGETVTILAGTDISVGYDTATNTFTIGNTSTAAIVAVNATSGLTAFGTTTRTIAHTNTNSISNNISGLYVNDYGIDAYGHVSSVTPRDLTTNLDARYVNKDGDTMSGTLTITDTQALIANGNVTIYGDLYVSGTTVTVDTENLTITDNIIVINSGETGAGVSRVVAGLLVDRGSEPDYVFLFDESQNDTFRVGVTGQTQAVATRNDTIADDSIMFWNSTQTRLDPIIGSPSNNQIILYNGSNWVYDSLASASGIFSWNTISGDTGSITTSSANQAMTISGGNVIETVGATSTLTINHSTVSYSAPGTATNQFIVSLTHDTYGHITGGGVNTVDFSVAANTGQFLSASTLYFDTMNADSGTFAAATIGGDSFTIEGGLGITTTIVGSKLTIDSNSSELQYQETLGGTETTLTDPDFTSAKVVIIDYLIHGTNDQEGQIRFLVSDGTIVHDYQSQLLNLSFTNAGISSADLILYHDTCTDTFEYYVRIIK